MIVIPMAGTSRRFHEAGYKVPKFMLELHGKTLFAHSVESFRAYSTDEFLFIARGEDGIQDFIMREAAKLGLPNARVVLLPGPTAGQAETVRVGLAQVGAARDTPLTIFNIDTFRPDFRYPETAWWNDADAYLEVIHSTDPGFSFVLPQPQGEDRVALTAEKSVVSDLASTGLYWFRRAGDFIDAMEDPIASHGELYVAPLYNHLIQRGLDVRYALIPAEAVIFCGIPSQYEELRARVDSQ